MHEGLPELGQKPTIPVTNYLVWHAKLTNNVDIEYYSQVRSFAKSFAGNKTYILGEPINNRKKTELNPLEVGRWVIKSIVTYSNG